MKKQTLTLLAIALCSTTIAQVNYNQYGTSTLLNNYGNITGGGAIINALNNHENTRGTRFLFNNWLKGTVTDAQGVVVNNDSLLFNFDKQANNLIVTKDKQSIISIMPNQIKDFTLTDGRKSYHFARQSTIDSSKILLALVENKDKYSLYKSIKAKFIKADYHTNGIVESGHDYDEYQDENTYYLLLPGGVSYKPVELKAKSIKSAFSAPKSKLYSYMGDHIDDEIDENYLIGLVNYLNEL